MQPHEIKQLIEAGLPESAATVRGDGSHYEVVVVSDAFEGKSMLEEQRMIYALLTTQIASGAIHAINIRAYTRAEWETAAHTEGS